MARKGVHPYLPCHNPKGVHIAGLGGERRATHDFWSVAARESARAGPTLRRPTCGVRENGCIANAGDEGGVVFVNKDVCLRREVMVNYM